MSRKSFRYWNKENFDTSPRYESLVIIEFCHFLWDPFILTNEKKVKKLSKIGCSKSSFPRKRLYLSEYESYRPETGLKIFFGSIPKTFPWHPKDLLSRKNVLGEPIFLKSDIFFASSIRIAQNLPQFLFWLFSAIFHSNWDL